MNPPSPDARLLRGGDGGFAARDPGTFLAQFLNDARTRVLGPADVVYVLKTVARELVSGAGMRGKCPHMELFTDWTVHGEIDRSPVSQNAIAAIAEAIPLHGTGGRDNKWLEDVVNDAVSFGALRLELVSACRRFQLPEEFFTSWTFWQRFAIPLAFEVSGRRIALGDRASASKAARNRIAAVSLEPAHQPSTLAIVVWQEKHWWRVETTDGTSILIQALLGEFPSTDFPTPPGWASPLGRPGAP